MTHLRLANARNNSRISDTKPIMPAPVRRTLKSRLMIGIPPTDSSGAAPILKEAAG